jgi:hypothetical protein
MKNIWYLVNINLQLIRPWLYETYLIKFILYSFWHKHNVNSRSNSVFKHFIIFFLKNREKKNFIKTKFWIILKKRIKKRIDWVVFNFLFWTSSLKVFIKLVILSSLTVDIAVIDGVGLSKSLLVQRSIISIFFI